MSGGKRPEWVRQVAYGLVGVAVVGAFVAIALLVSGSNEDESYSRVIGTALGLGLLLLPAAAGANLIRRTGVLRAFGYLAVAVAAIAFGIFAVVVWTSGDFFLGGEDIKPVIYSVLAALLTGILSALLATTSERDGVPTHLARSVTMAAIAGLIGIAVVEVASGSHVDPRVLSTLAILFVLGTLSLFLLVGAAKIAAPPAETDQA